jgi:DNA-binding transcriptional LysR family regulator
MDFDQLTTFVQVAKLKSFSKAGQKVFRSQSAVSAQIRQLEQAYHAKLLDRSAKSVELTPAGQVLFEFAERLLRLRDESMQVVADRGNVVQGPISLRAGSTAPSTIRQPTRLTRSNVCSRRRCVATPAATAHSPSGRQQAARSTATSPWR